MLIALCILSTRADTCQYSYCRRWKNNCVYVGDDQLSVDLCGDEIGGRLRKEGDHIMTRKREHVSFPGL